MPAAPQSFDRKTQRTDADELLLRCQKRYDVPGVHPATSNKVMTAAQRDWMCSTRLPLVKVVLHRQDEAASAVLQTVSWGNL